MLDKRDREAVAGARSSMQGTCQSILDDTWWLIKDSPHGQVQDTPLV
jgi:hypothetical protein